MTNKYGIPVIAVLREGGDPPGCQACSEERRRLRDEFLAKGVGVYPTADRALRSLARMTHYYRSQRN